MKKQYKNFIRFIVIIISIVLIYWGGYAVGHNNLILEAGYKPKITNIDNGKPKDVDFSSFWDVWNLVKTTFIQKNLDYQKMVYGAISGMLQSLGDPYTMFMDPEESKMFNQDLNGSFGGIGVEITVKSGLLVIISPLDNSPAAQAGIRSKDIILKIDGEEVDNLTYTEAINKIRGEKGTEVTLTVLHSEEQKPADIKITRDIIKDESVKWEIKDDNIMYVRISQFGDDTKELFDKMASETTNKNISKMIVDVRDNPGGYLTTAVDVASLFIEDGIIVQEENRNGDKTVYKTTSLPRLKDIKLAVLINGGSASASEIFAGAIKDTERGQIIGEKSFGKGSVQTLEKMADGSQVKITIAKWLTPKGTDINKEGIVPTIEIKMTKEDIANDNDVQLKKAIDEVNK